MPTLQHISQGSYGVKNNHNFHQNTRTYFLLLLPTTHYKAEKKTATISTCREVTESELMLPTTTLMLLLLVNTTSMLDKGGYNNILQVDVTVCMISQ
jgi:hypothetical protein